MHILFKSLSNLPYKDKNHLSVLSGHADNRVVAASIETELPQNIFEDHRVYYYRTTGPTIY